jgi:hypothetical protein
LEERQMKMETAQRLVAQAANIAGFVPLYTERGVCEVREIKGEDHRGAWITNCPTSNMMAYIRIPRSSQVRFVARARDIIARAGEIRAQREALRLEAMER